MQRQSFLGRVISAAMLPKAAGAEASVPPEPERLSDELMVTGTTTLNGAPDLKPWPESFSGTLGPGHYLAPDHPITGSIVGAGVDKTTIHGVVTLSWQGRQGQRLERVTLFPGSAFAKRDGEHAAP